MKNELITLFMIISVCHGQTQGTTVNTPAVTEVKGSIIVNNQTDNIPSPTNIPPSHSSTPAPLPPNNTTTAAPTTTKPTTSATNLNLQLHLLRRNDLLFRTEPFRYWWKLPLNKKSN
jgi:hypothetical protein